uniref:Uncharacterized protein n=1 Tax=Glossina morsitans morsitans TaxID=37546 RepID=A0A1B0GBI7_GLOMM
MSCFNTSYAKQYSLERYLRYGMITFGHTTQMNKLLVAIVYIEYLIDFVIIIVGQDSGAIPKSVVIFRQNRLKNEWWFLQTFPRRYVIIIPY